MERDAEIRQIIEEKREARKQKLLMRLGRNLRNPLSVSSLEALTGTLRSKKAPPNASIARLKEDPKEVIIKQEIPEKKQAQLKRTLSFGQTATSLRRTNIANGGASTLKRSVSFKSVATPVMKIVALSKATQVARAPKPKLTVPYSPNFSNRVRPPVVKPPLPSKQSNPVLRKTPADQTPKSLLKKAPLPGVCSVIKTDPPVTDATKRKSSTWMVPLTPEQKMPPPKCASSPRTPIVKPFIRKSFSESKNQPNRSVQLARSVSNATMIQPSSIFPRKSVANTTLSKESRFSRSIWSAPKEPSEKEKIQQWLEKRGRSISSCRHLGCLGQQLKDFQVPEKKPSSVRQSIRVLKPSETAAIRKSISPLASPHFKRTSVLNTTFEKEDSEDEKLLTPPPPPAFQDEVEEEIDAGVRDEEAEDKFHTPAESKQGSTLDLTDLQEGRVDKLLETIAALFQEPVYPQAKIESWINQSVAAFPAVKSAALYWDIKARLEERRGNTIEALDIYSEALQNKAEPLDTMKQLFDNFLLRIGSSIPTGQRTPLLKSLGVETPEIRQSRRLTSLRRPLLDSTQAFNSTTVKYELKLKHVFDSVGREPKENRATPIKKTTPPKFTAASNGVSVDSANQFQLVATPVRRSMRPKSMRPVTKIDEQVLYVDNLDQLSPTTKAKAVVRKNNALA